MQSLLRELASAGFHQGSLDRLYSRLGVEGVKDMLVGKLARSIDTGMTAKLIEEFILLKRTLKETAKTDVSRVDRSKLDSGSEECKVHFYGEIPGLWDAKKMAKEVVKNNFGVDDISKNFNFGVEKDAGGKETYVLTPKKGNTLAPLQYPGTAIEIEDEFQFFCKITVFRTSAGSKVSRIVALNEPLSTALDEIPHDRFVSLVTRKEDGFLMAVDPHVHRDQFTYEVHQVQGFDSLNSSPCSYPGNFERDGVKLRPRLIFWEWKKDWNYSPFSPPNIPSYLSLLNAIFISYTWDR